MVCCRAWNLLWVSKQHNVGGMMLGWFVADLFEFEFDIAPVADACLILPSGRLPGSLPQIVTEPTRSISTTSWRLCMCACTADTDGSAAVPVCREHRQHSSIGLGHEDACPGPSKQHTEHARVQAV